MRKRSFTARNVLARAGLSMLHSKSFQGCAGLKHQHIICLIGGFGTDVLNLVLGLVAQDVEAQAVALGIN